MTWPAAFLVTLLVELPFYVIGGWALGLARPRRAAVAGLVVNAVTHPVLWVTLSGGPASWAGTGVAEAIVVVVEGILVRLVVGRSLGWSTLLALGANAASFAVGLVVSVAVA